jgi:hypothetical protein
VLVLLLYQAYFHHQATVIQKCWRGYFSRSRVHDFYKRKAYLAAVAAANAAVRAGMAAELQEALQHQQQHSQQAAKQHFDAQVGCRIGVCTGGSMALLVKQRTASCSAACNVPVCCCCCCSVVGSSRLPCCELLATVLACSCILQAARQQTDSLCSCSLPGAQQECCASIRGRITQHSSNSYPAAIHASGHFRLFSQLSLTLCVPAGVTAAPPRLHRLQAWHLQPASHSSWCCTGACCGCWTAAGAAPEGCCKATGAGAASCVSCKQRASVLHVPCECSARIRPVDGPAALSSVNVAQPLLE